MGFTEKDVYEVLGLGGKAQEIAEPAPGASQVDPEPTASGAEGAQEQEVAEPAQDGTNTEPNTNTEPTAGNAEPEEPADDADNGTGADKQPLTIEQRRQNAARRREQERQADIDLAVQNALKSERERQEAAAKDFFAKAGMKNTLTGEPITNMEQFNAWQSQFSTARLDQDLKAGKLTPEGLQQAISEHPVVKQAGQMIQQSAQAKEQAERAQFQTEVDRQLAEIAKLDPSIQSVADLLNMPNAKEFRELVNQGKNFLEAYKLLNFESIVSARAEAAKQQALTNNRGKDHLQATGNSRGNGATAVPQADMELYRLINPGATDAQIQAHYNKYKK